MSKQIIAGGVAIGGGAPVTIQSMCNTHTEDAKATIAQIHALEEAGLRDRARHGAEYGGRARAE